MTGHIYFSQEFQFTSQRSYFQIFVRMFPLLSMSHIPKISTYPPRTLWSVCIILRSSFYIIGFHLIWLSEFHQKNTFLQYLSTSWLFVFLHHWIRRFVLPFDTVKAFLYLSLCLLIPWEWIVSFKLLLYIIIGGGMLIEIINNFTQSLSSILPYVWSKFCHLSHQSNFFFHGLSSFSFFSHNIIFVQA